MELIKLTVYIVSLLVHISRIPGYKNDTTCWDSKNQTIDYGQKTLWIHDGLTVNFTLSSARCQENKGSVLVYDNTTQLDEIGKLLCLDDTSGYYVSSSNHEDKFAALNNSSTGTTCDLFLSNRLTTVNCSQQANVVCQKDINLQISPESQNSTNSSEMISEKLDLAEFESFNSMLRLVLNKTINLNETNIHGENSSIYTTTLSELSSEWAESTSDSSTISGILSTSAINTYGADIATVLNSTLAIPEQDLDLNIVNKITENVQNLINTSSYSDKEVTSVLAHLSKVKETNVQTVQLFSTIVTEVISNYNTTVDTTTTSNIQPNIFSNVLLSMENVLESRNNHKGDLHYSTSEIDLSSQVVTRNSSIDDNSTCDHISFAHAVGFVVFPINIFLRQKIRVSTIVYHSIHEKVKVMKHYRHARAKIGSNVVSVSLQRVTENKTERINIDNVEHVCEIVLPTEIVKREKNRFCTFWNYKDGSWDTSGSTVKDKNKTHTTCVYNHLTNLAVLVLYFNDNSAGRKEQQILMILTSVGCSLSIACLGMTLVAYIYVRVLANEKILIHANLALALLMAQLVVVTSQGAEKYPIACKAVALLLHLFFMSAFTWMLMEGFALYLACTKGLHNYGDMRWKYCLIGWGLPLIIVLVSFGTEFQDYGHGAQKSCWLSTKNGLIWAFMGPMLVIVVLNIFVLGLVMKVFLTLKAVSKKSETAKLRASLKTMLTLLPLLGFTWLLSVLVPISNAFHYLFVIGNSMQGMMIFFLHCVGNDEVRKKFIEKRRRFSSTGRSTSETDLTGINHRRTVGDGMLGYKEIFKGATTTNDLWNN